MAVPRGDRFGLGGPRIVVLADERGRCHLVNMDNGTVYWCCEDTKSDVIHRQNNVEDYVDARVLDDGKLLLRRHQKDKEAEIILCRSDEILQYLKAVYGDNVVAKVNTKDFNVDYNTGSIIRGGSNSLTIRKLEYQFLVFSYVTPILQWTLRFWSLECCFPTNDLSICCKCHVHYACNEEHFFKVCKNLQIKKVRTDSERWAHEVKGNKIKILNSEKEVLATTYEKFFSGIFENVTPAIVKVVEKNLNLSESIENIKLADGHENVLRYYGSQTNGKYHHMAFETCKKSLKDTTWENNEADDAKKMKVIRGIIKGVAHLHNNGIVHGNLCPANVLLDSDDNPKLTGLGRSKRVVKSNKKEFHTDLVAVGRLILYCITGCKVRFDCENPLLFLYRIPEKYREAEDLITKLVKIKDKGAISIDMMIVRVHFLLWNFDTRLSFTSNISDRLLAEEEHSVILKMLEEVGIGNIIKKGKEKLRSWKCLFDDRIHTEMQKNVKGAHVTYNYTKVGSLVRFMRNVINHHKELQGEALVLLGESKLALERGFCEKFPGLLPHLYNIARMHLRNEMEDYFPNPLWID